MGKYKFGTMLCCLFNFALTVLIFVLMFSFISGGKVYVSVVGEDLRFDNALECVPTPKADNRVCGVLEKNEPIPDGWRLMATNDVQDWKGICEGQIEKKQRFVLSDGKFEGEKWNYKVTTGGYWGCENTTHKLVMKEDCRPLPKPDLERCDGA